MSPPAAAAVTGATKTRYPSGKNGRAGERAGGRHVRTGCITCKIRHVKCDEEKPACHQCRKTGRVCDGYASDKAKSPVQVSLALEAIRMPMARLDHGFLGSSQERRSFQMFELQIGKDLLYAFNTTRAHQLILQASHSNDAIKHAVVALGALGEHLASSQVLVMEPGPGDQRLDFTRLQYSKAVHQLQHSVSNPTTQSLELILMCCVLLTTFDFLCGDDSMAQVHLKAGLAILRRCYSQELQSRVRDEASDVQQSDPLIYDLFRIFSVMDLHAAIWLGLSSFHSPPLISPHAIMLSSRPDSVDPTLDAISLQLNYHLMRAHAFRHCVALTESDLDSYIASDHVLAEKQLILSDLQTWPSMLEQYLSSIQALPPPTISRRIALMRMNYSSTLISLLTFLPPPKPPNAPQLLLPTLQPIFAQILTSAHQILHPASPANRNALSFAIGENSGELDPRHIPPFAFVAGAIQPLYVTAVKCEDVAVCETAVSMLEEVPWREGAWNSAVMARIARRCMREKFSRRKV